MRIEPRYGVSSPATARSNVVLPLPDGPSSATTFPGGTVAETPLRITWWPQPRAMSWTMRSACGVQANSDGEKETEHDHDDIDYGKLGNVIDPTVAER